MEESDSGEHKVKLIGVIVSFSQVGGSEVTRAFREAGTPPGTYHLALARPPAKG